MKTNIRTNTGALLSVLSLLSLAGGLMLSQPAQAQTCALYPIAVSAQTLSGVEPNTVVLDIFNGVQPGNFGWLTWAGNSDEPTLVASLTAPGNSSTYVNPDDESDHEVSVGDWVRGKPGVKNSIGVRDALDALEDLEIIIPVWDDVRGSGSRAAYHISAFARVRLIGYHLPSQNRITVLFLGYEECGAPPV